MKSRTLLVPGNLVVLVGLVSVLTVAGLSFSPVLAGDGDAIEFNNAHEQTREFMRYDRTITLNDDQEAIRRAALTPLPAPCCSDNTLYTCCCSCNLGRSVWGLSKLLISRHDYNAEQVREKVVEWLDFIAPNGFSGDVCSTGGCGRAFKHNGCGGMREDHLVWGE